MNLSIPNSVWWAIRWWDNFGSPYVRHKDSSRSMARHCSAIGQFREGIAIRKNEYWNQYFDFENIAKKLNRNSILKCNSFLKCTELDLQQQQKIQLTCLSYTRSASGVGSDRICCKYNIDMNAIIVSLDIVVSPFFFFVNSLQKTKSRIVFTQRILLLLSFSICGTCESLQTVNRWCFSTKNYFQQTGREYINPQQICNRLVVVHRTETWHKLMISMHSQWHLYTESLFVNSGIVLCRCRTVTRSQA